MLWDGLSLWQCLSHLTVTYCLIMVSIGQQHFVQSCLQAWLRFSLEKDVVRKGPVHICHKKRIIFNILIGLRCWQVVEVCMFWFILRGEWIVGAVERQFCLTCVNGFLQLGVMLHGQQGLVITWFALQLFLGTACCHPDPGAVLIRYTFTHIPFDFQNRFYNDVTLPRSTGGHQNQTVVCMDVCVLYLLGSSLHEVSLEGAWTISWTFCWGQLRTHSSSPCRIQNHDVSRSRRGRSCWGKSTQSSTMHEWMHKADKHCEERTDSRVIFLPTLLSLFYSLMTDTTTASSG